MQKNWREGGDCDGVSYLLDRWCRAAEQVAVSRLSEALAEADAYVAADLEVPAELRERCARAIEALNESACPRQAWAS